MSNYAKRKILEKALQRAIASSNIKEVERLLPKIERLKNG